MSAFDATPTRRTNKDILTGEEISLAPRPPATLGKTLSIGPIKYISINLGPKVGENGFLAGVRVVPAGRKGNIVYGRTLNPGETDPGEGIPLEVGEILEFPAGSIHVAMAEM